MENFLETYKVPFLNQEEGESLNKSISKEIESVIKNLLTKKSIGPDGFIGKFYLTFKELKTILLKLFHKIKEEGKLTNLVYKVSIILTPEKENIQKLKKRGYYFVALL